MNGDRKLSCEMTIRAGEIVYDLNGRSNPPLGRGAAGLLENPLSEGQDRTMSNYESLGVRPVINAFATVTKYGGSLMPPEVIAAMNDAAGAFVDLQQLQRAVGERIAELTRNEDAYVTSGAAAGIVLAAAASVLYKNPDALKRFPNLCAFNNEAIIFRSQRNPYDYSIKQTGLTLRRDRGRDRCPARCFHGSYCRRLLVSAR